MQVVEVGQLPEEVDLLRHLLVLDVARRVLHVPDRDDHELAVRDASRGRLVARRAVEGLARRVLAHLKNDLLVGDLDAHRARHEDVERARVLPAVLGLEDHVAEAVGQQPHVARELRDDLVALLAKVAVAQELVHENPQILLAPEARVELHDLEERQRAAAAALLRAAAARRAALAAALAVAVVVVAGLGRRLRRVDARLRLAAEAAALLLALVLDHDELLHAARSGHVDVGRAAALPRLLPLALLPVLERDELLRRAVRQDVLADARAEPREAPADDARHERRPVQVRRLRLAQLHVVGEEVLVLRLRHLLVHVLGRQLHDVDDLLLVVLAGVEVDGRVVLARRARAAGRAHGLVRRLGALHRLKRLGDVWPHRIQ